MPTGTVSGLGNRLTFAPVRGLAATAAQAPPGALLWSYTGNGAARQVGSVAGPSDTVDSLSFHPGGNLLAAASNDFTTTVWDVADPAQPFTVQTLTDDTAAVNDAVFSPDGRLLVSGSSDGTAEVWTLNSLPAIAADPVGLACQLTGGGFTPRPVGAVRTGHRLLPFLPLRGMGREQEAESVLDHRTKGVG